MLLRRSLVVLALLLSCARYGAIAQQRADVFTVAPVAVDVTAANANAARDQAISEGERRGFDLLLQRLTLVADRNRLPRVSAAQLNDLVQSFEVAHERHSGVRYLADYTVHFRPEAVRQLLRQAGVGFAETRNKPVVILPVLRQDDRSVLWDDPNPWRDAWGSANPATGLVPVARPLGELADVETIDAQAASRGDDERLQAISQRYGGDDVLVTQAVLKADGSAHAVDVTTTRYSPGSPGAEQTWVTAVRADPGESDRDMLARAAASTLAQMEEAWKAANILDYRQSGTILARVPATSLQDWLAVRDRLSGVPAVRGSRLLSLDRAEARIEIRYVGDPGQLRLALAQRDLELSGGDPEWVLQRRTAAAAPR
jgi:hypothetical protein